MGKNSGRPYGLPFFLCNFRLYLIGIYYSLKIFLLSLVCDGIYTNLCLRL